MLSKAGLKAAFAAVSQTDEPSQKDMSRVFTGIHDRVRADDFIGLNDFIAGVSPEDCSTISIILALRGTFPLRSKLPAWPALLDKSHQALDMRGEDSNRILRGLKPS